MRTLIATLLFLSMSFSVKGQCVECFDFGLAFGQEYRGFNLDVPLGVDPTKKLTHVMNAIDVDFTWSHVQFQLVYAWAKKPTLALEDVVEIDRYSSTTAGINLFPLSLDYNVRPYAGANIGWDFSPEVRSYNGTIRKVNRALNWGWEAGLDVILGETFKLSLAGGYSHYMRDDRIDLNEPPSSDTHDSRLNLRATFGIDF